MAAAALLVLSMVVDRPLLVSGVYILAHRFAKRRSAREASTIFVRAPSAKTTRNACLADKEHKNPAEILWGALWAGVQFAQLFSGTLFPLFFGGPTKNGLQKGFPFVSSVTEQLRSWLVNGWPLASVGAGVTVAIVAGVLFGLAMLGLAGACWALWIAWRATGSRGGGAGGGGGGLVRGRGWWGGGDGGGQGRKG